MALKFTEPFDPNEVKDYKLDWAAEERIAAGDTITGSSWEIPAEAVGLQQPAGKPDTFTDTDTTIWLEVDDPATQAQNLVDNGPWELLNTITTAAGRTLQQTVKLKIKEL